MVPVAGPRVSPGHFLQFLTHEVATGYAEAMVTTEFKQPQPVFIYPTDDDEAKGARPSSPVGPNAITKIA